MPLMLKCCGLTRESVNSLMMKMYSCDKEKDALAVHPCSGFTDEMQVNTGEAIIIFIQFCFLVLISSVKYHSIIMQVSWVLELAGNKTDHMFRVTFM